MYKMTPLKPKNRPRKRHYRAAMHDDSGNEHMVYLVSSGIEAAWRTSMAEADARFLSLCGVEYLTPDEFLSQTQGV